MAIRDVFKFSRKTFFNPSGWADLPALKSQNQTIVTVLKTALSRPEPGKEETFEEAMTRLNLSEDAVKIGASNYRIFALIFLLLGILIFCYSFFLLFRYHVFLSWLLGMSVTALLLGQAFKYDFWSLQMRKRRLGITFKEWQESVLGSKGKNS